MSGSKTESVNNMFLWNINLQSDAFHISLDACWRLLVNVLYSLRETYMKYTFNMNYLTLSILIRITPSFQQINSLLGLIKNMEKYVSAVSDSDST